MLIMLFDARAFLCTGIGILSVVQASTFLLIKHIIIPVWRRVI